MRRRQTLSVLCCVFLVVPLAACSTDDEEAIGFCDAAESVRGVNLELATTLGGGGTWADIQQDAADQLAELEEALAAASGAENGAVADELQLWRTDTAALRDRVGQVESVEDLLYAEDADRPDPNQLNPALERIDDTFDEECGFRARS